LGQGLKIFILARKNNLIKQARDYLNWTRKIKINLARLFSEPVPEVVRQDVLIIAFQARANMLAPSNMPSERPTDNK
jgi:hypothetical protein